MDSLSTKLTNSPSSQESEESSVVFLILPLEDGFAHGFQTRLSQWKGQMLVPWAYDTWMREFAIELIWRDISPLLLALLEWAFTCDSFFPGFIARCTDDSVVMTAAKIVPYRIAFSKRISLSFELSFSPLRKPFLFRIFGSFAFLWLCQA